MSEVRRKLVAGNWKMNGDRALLNTFIEQLNVPQSADVLLCLPYPYLGLASQNKFSIGAQDCSEHEKGAHTGDVSLQMLQDLSVEYVIIGHSERRQDHNESNAVVAKKMANALSSNIKPILCIGEPLEVRENGDVFAYVQAQLDAVLAQCGDAFFEKLTTIAYEPIWAIGTGKTATPEQAQEVHGFIREYLTQKNAKASQMRLLYGGSLNASNATALLAQKDIDGGLIGGASLKIDDFNVICQAAS
ncbi:triose-phosphate isomerase [Glaciecola sp. XM2]|jgi:triosephosphate isomerase|uniref:triose-phosphate isomerase n=1 Tax=Glaciecola sp. XM2 TaxID=1914931 RepID=UPI001BDE268F|nr:triose-phosphate isomerase [Glaciecola sp. XM2]MBT1452025.1 triose-phosphate isomerase [Glaciecola sp. XM2]